MSWNPLAGWLSFKQQGAEAAEAGGDGLKEHSETASDSLEDDTSSDEQRTPRVATAQAVLEPPSFSLNDNDQPKDDPRPIEASEAHTEQAPQAVRMTTPAEQGRPQNLGMPPPSKSVASSRTGLMPPPSRPTPASRTSAAASLRVPSTGPLPNRGPPVNSQQRVQGGLTPNATTKTSNARGKVLLSPGHSPMDWAALTKKGNMSGVDTFQRVTPSQLKTMTGRKGKPAWSSWQGRIYNITPYLPFHPGGEAELMKAAGRDGTKLFMDVHPWVNWENMLSTCLVGVLVPEGFGQSDGSSLEDMD